MKLNNGNLFKTLKFGWVQLFLTVLMLTACTTPSFKDDITRFSPSCINRLVIPYLRADVEIANYIKRKT